MRPVLIVVRETRSGARDPDGGRPSRGSTNVYLKEVHRDIQDVMTREVVTVQPGASLKDAAALLIANRIRPAGRRRPGRGFGVFSEADLLFKEQGDLTARWLSWLIEPPAVADRKKPRRGGGRGDDTPADDLAHPADRRRGC
jgi:hypothetical protein